MAHSLIFGIAGRERAADKTTQCTRLVYNDPSAHTVIKAGVNLVTGKRQHGGVSPHRVNSLHFTNRSSGFIVQLKVIAPVSVDVI